MQIQTVLKDTELVGTPENPFLLLSWKVAGEHCPKAELHTWATSLLEVYVNHTGPNPADSSIRKFN